MPLNWNQFILILCSILVASLIFHPNLVNVQSSKCPNQVKCPTLKAHVQCLQVPRHCLQCLLTSLCLHHHSHHQKQHHSSSDIGNPFASIPVTSRLANSADKWATTYPSATCPVRPLYGT